MAAIKQLVNKAASGDARALQQLLGLHRLLDAGRGDSGPEPLSRESDQQLIASILKRITRRHSGEG